MKVSEDVRRADVLGGAWYQAQAARQERPRLGPGDIQVVEILEREPRSWWAFEMMRPGYAQVLAVVGGIITPMSTFVIGVLLLFAETSTPSELAAKVGMSLALVALAVCLFAVGVYAVTETNWLNEVETAGDGPRVAASIVTVIGGIEVLASFFWIIIVIVAFLVALASLGSD